jgi:Domain of unknown function (DUF1707)
MDSAASRYPPGDFRVSDADRDRALSELSVAFQAGRLTSDEFDERSGLALRARTGNDLTVLLADLPLEHPPAARGTGLERADRALASRITIAATAAATAFTAIAVASALQTGPDLAQRKFMQKIMAAHGIHIPVPPAQGFDWVGTITPGVIAVLLVLLIVFMRLSRAPRRPATTAESGVPHPQPSWSRRRTR